MKHILVIGSMNMDLTIHTPRIPRPGETITGSDFASIPGGKGANQAVAAARLGGQVRMLGGVGRDVYAGRLLETLRAAGVGTDCIQSFDTSSGIAVITVCGGENQIVLDRGANQYITPEVIGRNQEQFAWADLVLFQLEIPLDTIVYAVKLAKQHGAAVLLNPAPMQPLPPELLQAVDIFVPNQHEAGQLLNRDIADEAQARAAARKLVELGIGQVIITLGGKGCVFDDGTESFHCGIFPVDTVDTTAAGDCFIGAYAVGLCEGMSARGAVRFASAASAVTVTRRGASSSLPLRSEADALLEAEECRMRIFSE